MVLVQHQRTNGHLWRHFWASANNLVQYKSAGDVEHYQGCLKKAQPTSVLQTPKPRFQCQYQYAMLWKTVQPAVTASLAGCNSSHSQPGRLQQQSQPQHETIQLLSTKNSIKPQEQRQAGPAAAELPPSRACCCIHGKLQCCSYSLRQLLSEARVMQQSHLML
jgi:hypothetical protein